MRPLPETSRKLKAALVLGGLISLGIVGCIVWREPPPSHPLVTTNPSAIQFPKPSLLDRWIPRNWGWLWKLKYAVLGKPKTITLTGQILDAQDAPLMRRMYASIPDGTRP